MKPSQTELMPECQAIMIPPTIRIRLTQGLFAVVDERDAPLVLPYKWRAMRWKHSHYAVRNARGVKKPKVIMMQREILQTHSSIKVDHRNGHGADNRRVNLRPATWSQNISNQEGRSSSGFKGVYWDAESDKWMVQLRQNKRTKTVGRFLIKEDAARAYDKAAIRLWGAFAVLNFGGRQ